MGEGANIGEGDVAVIAYGAISALGRGANAIRGSEIGQPAKSGITTSAMLDSAGLRFPFAAEAAALKDNGSSSRAADLLTDALEAALDELEQRLPRYRDLRIGVALGTSSGGMRGAEEVFALRAKDPDATIPKAMAQRATYFGPFESALETADLGPDRLVRRVQILTACAASTLAIGLGCRWLQSNQCDLVIAGGYDALSVFVAAGFEALRATTKTRPSPFRVGRDGMSVGEGASVVVLALPGKDATRAATSVYGWISGFGASSDAVHITAPDRTGGGLSRAAIAAMRDAQVAPSSCQLVSAHGTATPFNDAMEKRAIALSLKRAADDAMLDGPVIHPFKAQVGHTLGAAGAIETLAMLDCVSRGILPAAASVGELDPDASVRLLKRAIESEVPWALKLSAAFGGANAALVVSRDPKGTPARQTRRVSVRAFAHADTHDLVCLADATGVARDRLARLDSLGRFALTAVAALAQMVPAGTLDGAGTVIGHGFATIDTNERFNARRLSRGAQFVEPRVFPATSPHVVAGECAIVYGLTGPSFSVAADLDGGCEALDVAVDLVACGDATRMVVIAVDDGGPAARALLQSGVFGRRELAAGAVAALVEVCTGDATPLSAGAERANRGGGIGHLGLLARLKGL